MLFHWIRLLQENYKSPGLDEFGLKLSQISLTHEPFDLGTEHVWSQAASSASSNIYNSQSPAPVSQA